MKILLLVIAALTAMFVVTFSKKLAGVIAASVVIFVLVYPELLHIVVGCMGATMAITSEMAAKDNKDTALIVGCGLILISTLMGSLGG